ncbi:hypothetical protein QFC21_001361 [Naganishia friedmannii]|uniref:Uncharacterized protein n=1 Tax=Naganishia friedmannii TaxID=89922 RepID=A0ACC2W6G5_9TREE|nr:hypothetical protein QFC21_001361 [Naganishia friedmannii]
MQRNTFNLFRAVSRPALARAAGKATPRAFSQAVLPRNATPLATSCRKRKSFFLLYVASRSVQLKRRTRHHSGFASSESAPSIEDPAERQAMDALEEGTRHLEDGNVEAARDQYKKSAQIQKSAAALFNLGVALDIASAYILAKPPQAALAIRHLKQALELSPEDPEIAFNLAAVLESTGNNEPALKLYEKAVSLGVDRAQQNVRNVKAKIVAAKAAEADAKAT